MKTTTPLIEGKIYYGLHFASGIATYQGTEGPYALLVSEKSAKELDQTFPGKPVFVDHIDAITKENVKHEAVGYVVESFFNKLDGFHWCKFVITAEEGIQAIEQNRWKLSNAYIPKTFGPGGIWHGTDYAKEVLSGEYEHLAIVQNPRYQESVIMTPEQFKKYNEQKELDLKRLANSKENKGAFSMLNFFKKAKVENSTDLESTSVVLPKSKLEVTISKLVNDADEMEVKKHEGAIEANPDHVVKIKDSMVKVGELAKLHEDKCNELEALKKEHEELKAKNSEKKDEEKKEENEEEHKEEKKNEDVKEEEKEKNEEEKEEKKQNHLEDLKNAEKLANQGRVLELSMDQIARGKQRYGSN